MKTLGSLKNGRLPHAVFNHTMAQSGITQIGIMFNQCRHGHNMPVTSLN